MDWAADMLNQMVKHSEIELDSVFQALSDRTRRAILFRLAERECSVSELADPFHMSLAAVSKHIKVLESAGLVRKSKEGRTFRCKARLDPLRDVNLILERLASDWQTRFDALESLLSEEKETSDGTRASTNPDRSKSKSGRKANNKREA